MECDTTPGKVSQAGGAQEDDSNTLIAHFDWNFLLISTGVTLFYLYPFIHLDWRSLVPKRRLIIILFILEMIPK